MVSYGVYMVWYCLNMIWFVYNNHIASNLLHEITKTKQINCLYVVYVYEPLRPHIMYYLIEHDDTYYMLKRSYGYFNYLQY